MSSSGFIISSQAAPKQLLATAIGLALMSTGGVASAVEADASMQPDADAADRKADTKLDTVEVEGQYNKQASSPKYTGPLLDTPQTVTVVPKEVIDGQNLQRLQDILSTLPGITFGAGEGGGGYGDSVNLRGFTASSDITVDGIRDSAQYTRSDTFNLEQVELVNGASSVYSGAGSVGGSINLVSKAARSGDFTKVSAGLGSDSYRRTTLDTNQELGDSGVAVRLNVMGHHNDVPGRDVEKYERWGFAPSIVFGLGSDTTFSLSYLHQKDDNIPQYGVPYFKNAFNDGPLPGLDPSDYFGFSDFDKQEITNDTLTAVFNHEFGESLSIRNLTRSQKVDQLSRVTPPQGTWCLANNINPSTGQACPTTGPTALLPGQFVRGGPAGNTRDTTNRILATQTDLTARFNTGGVEHTMVTGFALAHESFDLTTGNSLRNPDGSPVYSSFPLVSISNPDHHWGDNPVNFIPTGRTHATLDNQAIYAFDTLKFSEHWLLNLGVRYEHNEGDSVADQIALNGTITPGARVENEENLLSYRAGLVFKPSENGSIYLAYGNSRTPSKASVNGSCTEVIPTPGLPAAGTNNCNVDPEKAINYELGAKWDLYDGRLSLTGSVFRNDRTNYKVNSGDPLVPDQQLDGHARVDGIALGISGKLTDAWSMFANYTYLDSEVIRGASRYSASLGSDYTKGDPLLNTPKQAMSLWTTYEIARGWQVGYGATYQGDNYVQQHSNTYQSGPLAKSANYWVQRAMVGWRVNRNFDLQLNVQNLADKEYYTRIRNNGWAVPGDGRSYTLTANYSF